MGGALHTHKRSLPYVLASGIVQVEEPRFDCPLNRCHPSLPVQRHSCNATLAPVFTLARSLCSWVAILAGALVVVVMIGPWLTTMDRGEITKTIGGKIADSKSSAAEYISSWTSSSGASPEPSMEIGDDEDIDYNDYADDSKHGDSGSGENDDDDYAYESPSTHDTQSTQTTQKTDAGASKEHKTFLEALKGCNDMVCVRDAHKLPKGEATFNFPHFLIIGFQKAATTSLHVHLGKHDAALRPAHKEPEHFTKECKFNPPTDCSKDDAENYVRKTLRLDQFIQSKGQVATFESSTHVVRKGEEMAPALSKLVPWAKLIVNVREPISRAASMLIHMQDVYDEGCLSEKDLGYCLHARSQIRGLHDGTTTYYDALSHWFTHWPEEQIHIVQYEELTNAETEDKVMKEVKEYIGLDPDLPKGGLTVINDRRFRISPEGWKMNRSQYEKLINLVKPDVEATLDLLEAHGKLRDRKAFLKRWTDVWESNLATCDAEGVCTIQLS